MAQRDWPVSDEAVETLVESIMEIILMCKGVEIEDESVDEAAMKIMSIISAAYRDGYHQGMYDSQHKAIRP